jgi:hypothetical protein
MESAQIVIDSFGHATSSVMQLGRMIINLQRGVLKDVCDGDLWR